MGEGNSFSLCASSHLEDPGGGSTYPGGGTYPWWGVPTLVGGGYLPLQGGGTYLGRGVGKVGTPPAWKGRYPLPPGKVGNPRHLGR